MLQPATELAGYCMAYRRAVYDEVGGIDTRYQFYCSDSDFALRVAQAGHPCYRVWWPLVPHLEHSSVSDPAARTAMGTRDLAAFKAKWGAPGAEMEERAIAGFVGTWPNSRPASAESTAPQSSPSGTPPAPERTRLFWPHAESLDWWDGPDRFKRVNRAEVSRIQNEATLRLMGALPGKKVDLGGPSLDEVAEDAYRGWEVLNISKHHTTVTVVGDACATPFPSETFAVVATFHSIEHMHDPVAFLKECARILERGGLLYVVCPDKRKHRHDMTVMGPGDRCYNEWSPQELLGLFRDTLPTFQVMNFDTRQNNYDFEIFARKT
jgi:hypothetical protein